MINYKKYYEVIKDFVQTHPLLIIFFFSFFLYITCGLYMSFYNDIIIKTRYDIAYSLDTGIRYYQLYAQTPCETAAHPYTNTLFPFIAIIKSMVYSTRFSMILCQSLIASSSCCLFFTALKNLNIQKHICIIFTGIFGISFSQLLTTTLPEIYVFSGFTQVLFLFYIINITKQKTTTLSLSQIFILATLTTLSFGINLVNIILSLITLIYLLLCVYKTNFKNLFITFFKIALISIFLITGLAQIQKLAHHEKTFFTPLKQGLHNKEKHPSARFMTNLPHKERIPYLVNGTFIQPFYAMKSSPSKTKKVIYGYKKIIPKQNIHYWIFADNQNIARQIPFLLFLFMPIFIILRSSKKFIKFKSSQIIYLLLPLILTNSVCNYFFDVKNSFLFSQNNLCYLVLLIALLYSNVPKKITVPACLAFLAYQIPINFYTLHKIQKFISQTATEHHSVGTWMLWALIVCICFGVIGFAITKLIKKEVLELPTEKKYLLYTSLYLGYTIIYEIFIILFQGRA